MTDPYFIACKNDYTYEIIEIYVDSHFSQPKQTVPLICVDLVPRISYPTSSVYANFSL